MRTDSKWNKAPLLPFAILIDHPYTGTVLYPCYCIIIALYVGDPLKSQSSSQSNLSTQKTSSADPKNIAPPSSTEGLETPKQIPLAEIISKAKPPEHVTYPSVPISRRVKLFFGGIPVFSALFIGATLYWLIFLWDIKEVPQRTRHYLLKLHNTFMSYFRPGTILRWESWRKNECAHCGACCEILWRCPFLKENDEGVSSCSVHDKRPITCRTFPIDPWSVKMISEESRLCSYEFTHTTPEKSDKA